MSANLRPLQSVARPRRALSSVQAAGLILLALLVFNAIFTPHFLSVQTFNVNLTQVATIVIVAIGMTLVISTGGIDLSVGSVMAISGAIAPMLFMNKGLPTGLGLFLSFLLPMLAGLACGLFNGLLITRFKIQPIIATLILFIAGRGIAQVMTNGNLQAFKNDIFQYIALGRPLGIPFQVILMAAIVALIAWLVRRSTFGRYVEAVGDSESAARLAGVPVDHVKLLVYALNGLLASIAGLIVIAINSASDANQVGLNMELDAIAAVAVGGTLFTGGRPQIVGTLLGALILQLIRTTLISNGLPDAAAMVVKASIIVIAVYLLRGRRSA